MPRPWLALLIFTALPAFAGRDFLTTDEVDQVRLAQEPNERLTLYTTLARQRLDQAQHLLTEERPGRSLLVHDLLEDYGQILDAIDTVADDALERRVNIAIGMKSVADAEKAMLPVLEKIRDSQPKDLARYQFVLSQAIDTTRDSLEASSQDLGKRGADVRAREAREKKEIESDMQPKDLAEKKAADQKAAAADQNKRKPPTLLRPGETVQKQP
jgi:hypothetical protein